MTSFFRAAVPAVLLSAFATPALAAQCLVDDPTGTPLNVRSAPNGEVLTTLPNGSGVDVVEETAIGTKRWFFIAQHGQRLGWVFGAYVVCKQSSDGREAAPNQPADQR